MAAIAAKAIGGIARRVGRVVLKGGRKAITGVARGLGKELRPTKLGSRFDNRVLRNARNAKPRNLNMRLFGRDGGGARNIPRELDSQASSGFRTTSSNRTYGSARSRSTRLESASSNRTYKTAASDASSASKPRSNVTTSSVSGISKASSKDFLIPKGRAPKAAGKTVGSKISGGAKKLANGASKKAKALREKIATKQNNLKSAFKEKFTRKKLSFENPNYEKFDNISLTSYDRTPSMGSSLKSSSVESRAASRPSLSGESSFSRENPARQAMNTKSREIRAPDFDRFDSDVTSYRELPNRQPGTGWRDARSASSREFDAWSGRSESTEYGGFQRQGSSRSIAPSDSVSNAGSRASFNSKNDTNALFREMRGRGNGASDSGSFHESQVRIKEDLGNYGRWKPEGKGAKVGDGMSSVGKKSDAAGEWRSLVNREMNFPDSKATDFVPKPKSKWQKAMGYADTAMSVAGLGMGAYYIANSIMQNNNNNDSAATDDTKDNTTTSNAYVPQAVYNNYNT